MGWEGSGRGQRQGDRETGWGLLYLSLAGAQSPETSPVPIFHSPVPARDLPTFFTWEFPSPFQMVPTTGFLEPGQTFQIKVTFQPLVAVIYDAEATCWYSEGSQQKCSMRLQAVGEACPPIYLPRAATLLTLAWPPEGLRHPPTFPTSPQALPLLCPRPSLPRDDTGSSPWDFRGTRRGMRRPAQLGHSPSHLCPSQMPPAAGEHQAQAARGPGCPRLPESSALWLCCCGLHQ